VADVGDEVAAHRLDPLGPRAVLGEDDDQARRQRGHAGVHVGGATAPRFQVDLGLTHLPVAPHLVHERHQLVRQALAAQQAHGHGGRRGLQHAVGRVDDHGRRRQHRQDGGGPRGHGLRDLGDLRLATLAVAPQPRDECARGGADDARDQQSRTDVHTIDRRARSPLNPHPRTG
jgi:hypothetical protein